MISGSLIWKQASIYHPRTTVEFTLSLTLSSHYYSNISEGDELVMPGSLMFGDETQAESVLMTVSFKV